MADNPVKRYSKMTPARRKAEQMDYEARYPMSTKAADMMDEGVKRRDPLQSAVGFGGMTVLTPLEAAKNYITGNRQRSEEDMSELAREVARGGAKIEGYKKGGFVSSASSRADGCAKRGKTRGRIV